MITIYKYKVEMSEDFLIRMPKGAEVLSVQVQHGRVQIWARVDTSQPEVPYRFGVHGTGHELYDFTENAPFIGTFQIAEGSLVFHLFGGEEV